YSPRPVPRDRIYVAEVTSRATCRTRTPVRCWMRIGGPVCQPAGKRVTSCRSAWRTRLPRDRAERPRSARSGWTGGRVTPATARRLRGGERSAADRELRDPDRTGGHTRRCVCDPDEQVAEGLALCL